MTKVIFGNHSSVLVPPKDRRSINQFYVKILGGQLMQADPDRDFICLGDNFFIAFLYGEVEDVGELYRNARAIWLELKSKDVAATRKTILDLCLVQQPIKRQPVTGFCFLVPCILSGQREAPRCF